MSDERGIHDEEQPRRFDIGLWRRVLGHARPYARPLSWLAASGLVVAAVDALLPWVSGLVIDAASGAGARMHLLRYSLYYLGLVALLALTVWFFIVMAGRAATGFAYDLRRAGFARLQDLSFSFYDRRAVGWLMARLTSDCDRVSSIVPWFLLDLVWGTALVVGVSVMMMILDTRLAFLVIAILPPLAIVSVRFQRALLRSQRAVRKANSLITSGFNEAIMGVRTTKALVREKEDLAEFRELTGTMYRHSVRNALHAAAYLPIVIGFGSIAVGLSLWRGGVHLGEGMSLGALVAFMQYAAFLCIPIQEMAERFTQLQAAQASAERLQGLLDTEPEIADSPDVIVATRGPGDGAGARGEPIRSIAFRRVSFAYKEGEPVLIDFNLEVATGETIALVGATGSGKSTIVNLLCRFYEPSSGVIELNGADYRKRSIHSLQSNLGIVLQSPHLFSGTVRENIRYGRLEASDAEVEAAARLVNADSFIAHLDHGYESPVGEGGNRLSTGQKQLVSLARAILANPEIFIMDEATSSVDTESERLIQDGIEKVLEGRISFIIAHRLSTVRAADRILVIEKGRIVEQGTHEELLHQRGRYWTLYTNQFRNETQRRILEEGEPPPAGPVGVDARDR